MFRALLLILVVLSSAVFAQTDEKPEARKIDEIGIANDEEIHERIDNFFIAFLNPDPNSSGYIINYGTDPDIYRRENQIKDALAFHKLDIKKVKFVNAGYRKTIKTEFWIVPAGAESPKLIPTARILEEFGKLSQPQWKKRMNIIGIKLKELKYGNAQIYIINYGKDKEIAAAELLLRKYLFENCYDCFGDARITIVRGGFAKKPRRVFWIVPAGAEPPTP